MQLKHSDTQPLLKRNAGNLFPECLLLDGACNPVEAHQMHIQVCSAGHVPAGGVHQAAAMLLFGSWPWSTFASVPLKLTWEPVLTAALSNMVFFIIAREALW